MNLEELNRVNQKFTLDTLREILGNATGDKNARVSSFAFGGDASAKGDSYLSTVHKIKITGTANNKECVVHTIVKSLPQNLGRRKTYRSTEFFHNEIIFYTEIIPHFKRFLKEKNQQHLMNVPECLAVLGDGKDDFLVLEDVSPLGYGQLARQSFLPVEDCKVVLAAMANFHAVSFAYKDQHLQDFKEATKSLEETYFSDRLWAWYERFHTLLVSIAKDALAKEYPGSKAEQKFNSYKVGDLYRKCIALCSKPDAPSSIVVQGDSWAPNFLARTKADGEREALMLDFQLARLASPIQDISFFLYSCTNQELRTQWFDELVKYYHEKLSEAVTSLGSDIEKLYPLETYLKEVKEEFILGFTFALESVPFSTYSSDEAFNLDAIEGDETLNIADIWTLSNLKTSEARRRLADVIVHAADKDFI